MGKVFQIFVIGLIVIGFGKTALSQDLGSSNSLFGSDKKGSTSKTTKKIPPKSSTRKATSSRSSRKNKSSASRTPIGTAKDRSVPGNSSSVRKTDKRVDPEVEVRYQRLIDEGKLAVKNGDLTAAEAAFRRALLVIPNGSSAYVGLGDTFSYQERLEDAETAYREAINLDNDYADAQYGLSKVLAEPIPVNDLSDRYEEAETLIRKATSERANDPEYFDQLGVVLEIRGKIGSESEAAYRRAIELDRAFAPAYAHLGRLLRKRGNKSGSAEEFKKAVSLATTVQSMIRVANIMQSEQRYADSIPLLTKAVNLESRNTAALLSLGRALIVTENLTGAAQILNRAASIQPDRFVTLSLLAKLYTREDKLAVAESTLLRALTFATKFEKPGLAAQFEAVGDAYLSAGDRGSAERVFRSAKSIDPDRPSVASKLRKLGAG